VRHTQVLTSIIQVVLPLFQIASTQCLDTPNSTATAATAPRCNLQPAECCKRECKIRILSPLPRGLPLPLLTTTVVSQGASVVSVGASAAFIVDQKNRQARKSPFCAFGLQFYWGPFGALSWSKCQVHCRSTEQTESVLGDTVCLWALLGAPNGAADSEFLLPSKYIYL
jgi:hypothetical protein